jgi:hypothetical protein
MAKTIKISASFESIESTTKSQEAKQVISDSADYECVTTHQPIKIPAGTAPNFQISLGGVTLAKRIFINSDYEVLVKFNVDTEAGFNLKGGMVTMNESGITALFVTIGANETTINMIAAGDC